MRPADGALEPAIISNSVVLPAPFGPMTPTISGCVERVVDVELEGRRAVEQAAAVDLGDAIEGEQRSGCHASPPSSRRLRPGSAVSVAASPAQATWPCDEHHDAVGDAERDVGVLLHDDGGDALLP